jgi:hypothetical protein
VHIVVCLWKWVAYSYKVNASVFFLLEGQRLHVVHNKPWLVIYNAQNCLLLLLEGWAALIGSSMSSPPCSFRGQADLHPSCRHITCMLALSTFGMEQHGYWRTGGVDQMGVNESRPNEGEWESIKISRGNSTYILKLTRRPSLLTRSRPRSYRKTINTQNWVRKRSENMNQCW